MPGRPAKRPRPAAGERSDGGEDSSVGYAGHRVPATVSGGAAAVERITAADANDAQQFFDRFIAQRKPCVIVGRSSSRTRTLLGWDAGIR